MKKRIEIRKLSDLQKLGSNDFCVCIENFCYEPMQASRTDIKRAKLIAENINDICIAFVHVKSKVYVLGESCSFLNRFVLFNAVEADNKQGIRIFINSPLSSKKMYSKNIVFKKGEVF